MKPAIEEQLQRLMEMLPPKQQTLDFSTPDVWRQLPVADQRACREAIAALLYQVTRTTPENREHE